jgi:hypothetical protein
MINNRAKAITGMILFILILSTSCQPQTTVKSPADNLTGNIVNKPPAPYVAVPPKLSKPYPGLDTAVSELVSAYENGGDASATAYAESRRLKLVDGMVMVIIEVKSEGKAAALDAVNNAGAKNVYISANGDYMQGFVPLNQIKALADNPAIRSISEPGGMIAN